DAWLTSLRGILNRLSAAAARIHLALDQRAFGHHQARRLDVAVDGRRRLQHHTLGRGEVAGDRSADADRLRRQIGLHGGARANHQTGIPDPDGPSPLTVDREVLLADDAPFDRERAANPCGNAAFISWHDDVVRHLSPWGAHLTRVAHGIKTAGE